MDQRKPKFIARFGFHGKCIAYPVTVHIDSKQWGERWILVPINQWKKGIRTFHYLGSNWACTLQETYTCTPKVEADIYKAVMAYHHYTKQLEELARLQEEIGDIYDYLNNLSKHFDGVEVE